MVILGGWVFRMSEVPELVFRARRLLYHSTLGLGVIKKQKKKLNTCQRVQRYRGTSLIRNTHPPRITIRP